MNKNLIVKQMDMKDCGACCILSIIKYYDGLISLEKLKVDTVTSKTGTTAFHLVETLKKYGFSSQGLKLKFTDLIQDNIVLPVIAHVTVFEKYLHFVVIYKIDKKRKIITIMDPAYGFRDISFQDFQNIWNEFIIVAYPISKIPVYKKGDNILNIYLKILFSQKNILKKIFTCSLCLTITNILSSFYFKVAINGIDKYNDLKFLFLTIIFFSFIYFLKVISIYLREYFENYLNKNIDINILCPFLKHIFYLPLNYAKSKTSGEIISRVNELNIVKETFSKIFVTLFLDLLLALITFIILFKLNILLSIILLIICLIYVLTGILFKDPLYDMVIKNIELETNFNSDLIEKIEAIETIKNMNWEKEVNNKIEFSLVKYLKNNLNFKKIIDMQSLIKNFINDMGIFILLSIGFYLYFKGKISLLNLITFDSLLSFLIEPLKNIVSIIPSINFIKASFLKISSFYEIDEEKLNDNYEQIDGDIEFKNVTFSYNKYNNILTNFNLKIERGEKIILNGKSGCGKSTICKLLYRLLEGRGEILINNFNINDIEINKLRNSITYISQREKLFTDTIKNNICYYKDISDEYLNNLIKICRLENIIQKSPIRLDTMIVEGGSNLSGGERQRIILARALVKKSNIYIIDEALSEVDEKLEKEIINDLLKFLKDKTVIYITHKNQKKLFEREVKLD